MKYTIKIDIDENGWPKWRHDGEAEALLTKAQYETVKWLYDRYHSAQEVWKTLAQLRQRLTLPALLDQEAMRMQARWQQSAEETERKLRASELPTARLTRKVG